MVLPLQKVQSRLPEVVSSNVKDTATIDYLNSLLRVLRLRLNSLDSQIDSATSSISQSIKSITATTYTVLDQDDVLLVDPGVPLANITLTLPASSTRFNSLSNSGRPLTIKNIHSNDLFSVTINPNGTDLIEDTTSAVLQKFVSLTLIPDASNWWVV